MAGSVMFAAVTPASSVWMFAVTGCAVEGVDGLLHGIDTLGVGILGHEALDEAGW